MSIPVLLVRDPGSFHRSSLGICDPQGEIVVYEDSVCVEIHPPDAFCPGVSGTRPQWALSLVVVRKCTDQ